MMQRNNQLVFSVSGSALAGSVRVLPHLDISQVGDRQKAFRLLDEYYTLVISLGGTMSSDHGDGRLRGLELSAQYGDRVVELFAKVKEVFDPYNTMNPGVKIGSTLENIKPLLRSNYTVRQSLEHMPRL